MLEKRRVPCVRVHLDAALIYGDTRELIPESGRLIVTFVGEVVGTRENALRESTFRGAAIGCDQHVIIRFHGAAVISDGCKICDKRFKRQN